MYLYYIFIFKCIYIYIFIYMCVYVCVYMYIIIIIIIIIIKSFILFEKKKGGPTDVVNPPEYILNN